MKTPCFNLLKNVISTDKRIKTINFVKIWDTRVKAVNATDTKHIMRNSN